MQYNARDELYTVWNITFVLFLLFCSLPVDLEEMEKPKEMKVLLLLHQKDYKMPAVLERLYGISMRTPDHQTLHEYVGFPQTITTKSEAHSCILRLCSL